MLQSVHSSVVLTGPRCLYGTAREVRESELGEYRHVEVMIVYGPPLSIVPNEDGEDEAAGAICTWSEQSGPASLVRGRSLRVYPSVTIVSSSYGDRASVPERSTPKSRKERGADSAVAWEIIS